MLEMMMVLRILPMKEQHNCKPFLINCQINCPHKCYECMYLDNFELNDCGIMSGSLLLIERGTGVGRVHYWAVSSVIQDAGWGANRLWRRCGPIWIWIPRPTG